MSFDNQLLYIVAATPDWNKACGDRFFLDAEDAQEYKNELGRGYEHLNVYEITIEIDGATFRKIE